MADDITVKLSEDSYKLAVNEMDTINTPSPEQILRFTAEDQIKTIQQAIGVEETGTWNADTNLAFTKWLRVQQAEHSGIENSDGWWGKNTQAALEGNIDEGTFNAIKGLYERENGGLRNLTWRNKYHNAQWEKIEQEVKAEAATQEQATPRSDTELAAAAAIPAGGIGLMAKKTPMDDFNRAGRNIVDDLDARFAAARDITPPRQSAAPPPEARRAASQTADIVSEAAPAMRRTPEPKARVTVPDELSIKASAAETPTRAPVTPEARITVPNELSIKASAAETPTRPPVTPEPRITVPNELSIKASAAETPTRAPVTPEPRITVPNELSIKASAAETPTRPPVTPEPRITVPNELSIKASAAETPTRPPVTPEPRITVPNELSIKASAAETPTRAPVTPEPRITVPNELSIKASAAETPTRAPVTPEPRITVPNELSIKASAAETPTRPPVTPEPRITVPNELSIKASAAETPTRAPAQAADIITEAMPAMKGSAAPPPEARIMPAAPSPEARVTVPARPEITRPAVQTNDIIPARNLAGEAAEAVNNPRPTMITIPQREASGWGARILEGLKAGAAESGALKVLGKGGRGILRALPAVGAGIAAAEVAYAQDDADLAITTGLMDENAKTALWAGYGTHVAQGGLDPTLFGGEAGTLGAFKLIEQEYGLDPVMAMMTRPALMADLGDQLFSDGMPDLSDEQVAGLEEKYSDENMRGIYDGIIERNGLPSTIYDEKAGTEIKIEDAVRDPLYMNRLEEAFEGNDIALEGLNELQFAAAAQDTAHQWIEKVEEQKLQEQQPAQENNAPEEQTGWSQRGHMPGYWGLN